MGRAGYWAGLVGGLGWVGASFWAGLVVGLVVGPGWLLVGSWLGLVVALGGGLMLLLAPLMGLMSSTAALVRAYLSTPLGKQRHHSHGRRVLKD